MHPMNANDPIKTAPERAEIMEPESTQTGAQAGQWVPQRIKVHACEIRRDGQHWLLFAGEFLERRLNASEEALVNSVIAASPPQAAGKAEPQISETWHILRPGAAACDTVVIEAITPHTVRFAPPCYGVPGDLMPRDTGLRFIERVAAAPQAAPAEPIDERKAFEADAGPLGFDLTADPRPSLSGEPWCDYRDIMTGHRWAGWLARSNDPNPSADESDR